MDLVDKPLHPFWVVRGDERVGKVSWLAISSGPGKTELPPRELEANEENSLFWLSDSGIGMEGMTPLGTHHSMVNFPHRMVHARRCGGWNWGLTRNAAVVHAPSDLVYRLELPRPLEKDSRRPLNSDRGDLFVPMPRHILHLHLDSGGPLGKPALRGDLIPCTEETRNAQLMPNRDGTVLVHARADQPFLYVRRLGDPVGARFETASGGAPACLAQGSGAEVWFLQTKPFGLGCLDTGTLGLVHYQPEGRAAEVLEPHAMAFGPDGNLWFTDPKGCRIGRITRSERSGTPVAEVTLFDLGKGQPPEEIVSSSGAWLYFTIKDQPLIGSIRAVDARPEEACGPSVPRRAPEAEAGDAGQVEGGGTAPPRRKPSGAQRRKRREERKRSASEPSIRPSVEDTAGGDGDPESPSPRSPETQACPPAKPAASSAPPRQQAPARRTRTPRERLEALYVRIDEPTLENHVLKRHAAHSRANASKFAPQYSDGPGLLKLLAESLDGAEIGRELRVDRNANFYTTCRCPAVGQWNGAQTGIFTVVTRLERDKRTGEWWHHLVTAFPGE